MCTMCSEIIEGENLNYVSEFFLWFLKLLSQQVSEDFKVVAISVIKIRISRQKYYIYITKKLSSLLYNLIKKYIRKDHKNETI